jgi:uncharacterized protein (TIGR00290 family)
MSDLSAAGMHAPRREQVSGASGRPPRAVVSWSSGKDSALALRTALDLGLCQVVALLTTVSLLGGRIPMHGVRRTLVEEQAAVLGLPLEIVTFNPAEPAAAYEAAMHRSLSRWQKQGASVVVCGDIFLESVRQRRQEKLAAAGWSALFPLWGRDPHELLAEFVRRGFKAIITGVDTAVLGKGFLGQVIDDGFVAELPPGVDPCGENGEYHTFVFDGPGFSWPVGFVIGAIGSPDGRYFTCDLLPKQR